jgi:hypothetical protein
MIPLPIDRAAKTVNVSLLNARHHCSVVQAGGVDITPCRFWPSGETTWMNLFPTQRFLTFMGRGSSGSMAA